MSHDFFMMDAAAGHLCPTSLRTDTFFFDPFDDIRLHLRRRLTKTSGPTFHAANMAEVSSDSLPAPQIPQDQPDPCPFHALPTEILLEIISAVPFTPSNSLAIRLTCRRFHDLFTQHEAPIAKTTARQSFPSRTLELFPCLEDIHTFQNLARLHARVATLDQVHEQWLKITSNSPELEWLKGRFEGVHKAGLLLLYHLQDLPLQQQRHRESARGQAPSLPICANCQRVQFLRNLPATSLACLLFKLISSVKILRVYGPEPINERWRKGDVASRSDVELVCEELILRHGPWFFVALLRPDNRPGITGQALG